LCIDTGDQPEDSSDAALPPIDLGLHSSGGNSELAAQAAHPAFRQALRDQLFKRLAAHRTGEAREKAPEQAPGAGNVQQHTDVDAIDGDPQSIPSYEEANAEAIQSDPELRALAVQLDITAPFAVIEPVFRQRLRTQLINALMERCYSSLEVLVGRLDVADNSELYQFVSAEDQIVFLDKMLLAPGKSPSEKLLLPLLGADVYSLLSKG
jgi:hypothetical protein